MRAARGTAAGQGVADLSRRSPGRWHVASAAVVLQLVLGTVHAWSVFRTPLSQATGWSIPEITLAYTLSMLLLGGSAPLGGLALARLGPRRVGLVAAVLYGLGTTLAGLAADRLWLLYLGYGVIGGVGLGLGFIVPVTVVLHWFPDRRGLLAGVAVAGFGAGALIASSVATLLLGAVGVFATLALLGPMYLLLGAGAAWFLHEPPADFCPAGWQPPRASARPLAATGYSTREALATWQFYALWSMLFLNVSAGSAVLSQAAALLEDVAGVDAQLGAAFVGLLALANALGRLLWTGLSDVVGRRAVFLSMFLLQALALLLLSGAQMLAAVMLLGMLVLLCYGGGFGTMAAFAADYFGPQHVGVVFGLLLTACGCGAVAGPLLMAVIRERSGGYAVALIVLAAGMLLGAAVTLGLRPPGGMDAPRQERGCRPALTRASPLVRLRRGCDSERGRDVKYARG